MDTETPERRSEIMALVKAKNTKPELAVRSLLHKLGFRFRLHRKDLTGNPDLVLSKHKTVVFVHGCFWHRHPGCPNTRTPKSKVEFWTKKFESNVRRDEEVREALTKNGWRVMVVWECELRKPLVLAERIREYFGAKDAVC